MGGGTGTFTTFHIAGCILICQLMSFVPTGNKQEFRTAHRLCLFPEVMLFIRDQRKQFTLRIMITDVIIELFD